VHADTHCDTPRPPHSVANVRDDRDTPPHVERNAQTIMLIWGSRKAIYVFRNILTTICKEKVICPPGKMAASTLSSGKFVGHELIKRVANKRLTNSPHKRSRMRTTAMNPRMSPRSSGLRLLAQDCST
jgi:hypothetical protein